MSKSILKKLIGITLGMILIPLAFNQCGKVDFAESGESEFGSLSIAANGEGTYKVTVQHAGSSARPLDLVWIIDNSGSMSAEAAHVRNNLASFANSLSVIPDVKLAVISSVGTTGTSVVIPTGLPIPTLAIDVLISSHNALDALGSAMCPVGAISGAPCASTSSALSLRGSLRTFLRSGSLKVFVVVTDDTSYIPAQKFEETFTSVFPGETPIVHGFVGIGAASSCQEATGIQYQDLARDTGGKIFNVCDQDWTPAFSQLSNHVVSSALGTISLPQEVLSGTITSVTVNEQTIPSSQYSLNPTGILFSQEIRERVGALRLVIQFKSAGAQ